MIKAALSFLFFLVFLNSYAQDAAKIKQIDSIVSGINVSTLPVRRDTIIEDHPELGLKMTTFLTMIVDSNELIKYVNYVEATMTEKGIERRMTGSNAFYYDHNNVIKVEEYLVEDGKRKEADWYYSGGKPLYHTLQSDKAASRAKLLLTMSKAMLEQVLK